MKASLCKYCVGCGLCAALHKATLSEDEKGYLHPQNADLRWLKEICPAGGRQTQYMASHSIWGKSCGVFSGWSLDPAVRQTASSGGALTALALYLLQSGRVDAVLHVTAGTDPTTTQAVCSTTPEQIIQRCGSRYAISHPLQILGNLDHDKRYALIGKPCDISVLQNLMEMDPSWKQTIPYTLSFFCAGLPSKTAQRKLLKELDCENCISLRYRGNGWPGHATATDDSGHSSSMDYDTSWGKILGRDLMDMCRYCLDGIGELADISAGDYWYLTPENTPDFTEHEGRNILFARTPQGLELLQSAAQTGTLHLESCPQYETELPLIQKYQFERRATMVDKLLALRLLARPVPHYPLSAYLPYSRHVSLRMHLRTLKGALRRGLQNRL